MPNVCIELYAPVCGCDGKTYSNACFAAAAGVNVAHDGECPSECKANADCPDVAYCVKPMGLCDGLGKCAARPDVCPDVWKPVCGCDGNTYGNACEAAMAGVSVDHDGACCVDVVCEPGQEPVDTDGDGCMDTCVPAKCQTNADCPDTHYCLKKACDDAGGVCVPRPDGCLAVWQPVCGCDGKTYGNACEAAVAGVNVDHDGPCCDPIVCLPGQTPIDTDGDGCPDQCICGIVIDCLPGYVPVDTDGDGCPDACEPAPCTSNADCPDTMYCKKDACDAKSGVCTERPTICPLVWAPVCGCDGQTYGNACEAAAAGVNVDHDGACCDPIVCKPGDKPADTDGDGCDDACVCEAALTCAEWCPGGKPWPCDPTSASCGVDAIICACPDGAGACVLCPPGTHAVDLDGDGCAEVCDCCPKLPCLPGQKPVDTDGDGCPDECICPIVVDCAPGYVPVDTDGDGCPDACEPATCTTNADCPKSMYCKKDACDAKSGVCAERPQICPDVWMPVCGCDGNTYGNACEAAAAGVNVAHDGACCEPIVCKPGDKPADTDGDGCDDACVCKGALTCDQVCPGGKPACDPATGGCGVQGDVNAIACECPDGYGVCAPCPPGTHATDLNGDGCPDICDCCPQVLDCAPGQDPVDVDGDGCPDECICPIVIDCLPGYVPVDTDGDGCPDACDPMKCQNNDDCPAGTYCAKDTCDAPGGQCVERPVACPLVYMPVCGCDGVTYGNACEAAAAGVNVAHDGACCDAVVCAPDQTPMDTDGDGCADQCICGVIIDCAPGYVPVDTDGNGCVDGCEPMGCTDGRRLPGHDVLPEEDVRCARRGVRGAARGVPAGLHAGVRLRRGDLRQRV